MKNLICSLMMLFCQCFTVLKYVDPAAPPTRQRGSAVPWHGWAGTVWSWLCLAWNCSSLLPKAAQQLTLSSSCPLHALQRDVSPLKQLTQSVEVNLQYVTLHMVKKPAALCSLVPLMLWGGEWCQVAHHPLRDQPAQTIGLIARSKTCLVNLRTKHSVSY